MNKKKLLWISLLIIFIIVIVIVTVKLSSNVKERDVIDNNLNIGRDVAGSNTLKNNIENSKSTYIKTELDDGILYSKTGEEVKADIIIGDNYFDTTINDMYINPNTYKGKNIEVEGFYMSNLPYTFVARYSTSNLCAYCPVGYSYIEYQLDGTIDTKFTDEKEWIKIIGSLEIGNDETSNYQDYYYLKVLSLKIMNERGQDTVNN